MNRVRRELPLTARAEALQDAKLLQETKRLRQELPPTARAEALQDAILQREMKRVCREVSTTAKFLHATKLLQETKRLHRELPLTATTKAVRELMDARMHILSNAVRQIDYEGLTATFREIAHVEAEIDDEDVVAVEAVVHEPEFLALPTAEQIDRLISAVKETVEPARKRLFVAILTALMTVFLNDICQYARQHIFGLENPAQTVREIRTVIRETHPSQETLKDLRVVSRSLLIVRQSPKGKSPPVACLEAGEVVRIVQKRKKWRLVERYDEDMGEPERGWVLSKYLSRLARH